MSMVTELFGEKILLASLAEVKEKIKSVPADRRERFGYLLNEYAIIKGIKLTKEDFDDATPNP